MKTASRNHGRQDLAAALLNLTHFPVVVLLGRAYLFFICTHYYALDVSSIDLCLSVFPWALFRSTKSAVKLHTLLDLQGNIPTFIQISDGKLHDINVNHHSTQASAEETVANTLAKARFWLRHQATVLNERQRKVLNRLLNAGPDGFEGGMNTRKYVGLARISRAAAYRELADLVNNGFLRPTGKGGWSSG